MTARVRAPELAGRGWLNTGGLTPTLESLRGRFVLLDFWTFCCVNCLHVLDELRPLERDFADVLTVIGVHSPKFEHEGRPQAVAAAVERYGVEHPVLDDPELITWKQYAVRAWPTLVLVDPEGYVVAQLSGEGHEHALRAVLADLVQQADAKGLLRKGSGPYEPPPAQPSTLRFPAKAVRLPGGTLLVADAGHHRVVELDADGTTLLRAFGDGERGLRDGDADTARFHEPNGLCLIPAAAAGRLGYDVVVADTVNHALRGLSSTTGRVATLAGTGRQWMQGDRSEGPALEVPLSSPWDVAWLPDDASPGSDGRLVVAMAGVHQLASVDPDAATTTVMAGTTQEGLVDGDAAAAWLAQPSGLALDTRAPDVAALWFVDAETSALRRVAHGVVSTAVGSGLFDFGHVDGPAAQALLQHPLGVAELPDGSVAVADTYNGAVRRYDPVAREVSTLAAGLAEPSDVLVVPDEVRGSVLLVVESAAHRLVRVPLDAEVVRVDSGARRTVRPPLPVRAGTVTLEVVFEPPPGQKLDDRYGPSTHVVVSSSPPELLVEGSGSGPELARRLVVAAGAEGAVLHVSARAASCDDPDVAGAAPFPACHVHQQDWGVPLAVMDQDDPTGTDVVRLVLSGPPS